MKKICYRTLNPNISKKTFFLGGIILLLLFLALPFQVFSQNCRPSLKPGKNPKIQYRERGDRCEGIYRSQVSSGSLNVVGLVEGKFRFELDKKEHIEVSASVAIEQPIYIRAMGIPIKTYYRLDTQLNPGEKLVWPVADVLYVERLSDRQIGVFGWIGEEKEKTFIPVVAEAAMKPGTQDGKIRLYLRASVDVKDVNWRFSQVIDGACSQFNAWQKAPKSSYRLSKPILITFPQNLTGETCIEVAAKDKTNEEVLKKNLRVLVQQ